MHGHDVALPGRLGEKGPLVEVSLCHAGRSVLHPHDPAQALALIHFYTMLEVPAVQDCLARSQGDEVRPRGIGDHVQATLVVLPRSVQCDNDGGKRLPVGVRWVAVPLPRGAGVVAPDDGGAGDTAGAGEPLAYKRHQAPVQEGSHGSSQGGMRALRLARPLHDNPPLWDLL